MQTILDTDVHLLGTPAEYPGYMPSKEILTANGVALRDTIVAEVQIVTEDGVPLTPWLTERCVNYSSATWYPSPAPIRTSDATASILCDRARE